MKSQKTSDEQELVEANGVVVQRPVFNIKRWPVPYTKALRNYTSDCRSNECCSSGKRLMLRLEQ